MDGDAGTPVSVYHHTNAYTDIHRHTQTQRERERERESLLMGLQFESPCRALQVLLEAKDPKDYEETLYVIVCIRSSCLYLLLVTTPLLLPSFLKGFRGDPGTRGTQGPKGEPVSLNMGIST